jgi:hypothetical protein
MTRCGKEDSLAAAAAGRAALATQSHRRHSLGGGGSAARQTASEGVWRDPRFHGRWSAVLSRLEKEEVTTGLLAVASHSAYAHREDSLAPSWRPCEPLQLAHLQTLLPLLHTLLSSPAPTSSTTSLCVVRPVLAFLRLRGQFLCISPALKSHSVRRASVPFPPSARNTRRNSLPLPELSSPVPARPQCLAVRPSRLLRCPWPLASRVRRL